MPTVSSIPVTNEFYLFRYNKPVSSFSTEYQLTDNPEVTVNSTQSPELQQLISQLDNIIEVRAFHSVDT